MKKDSWYLLPSYHLRNFSKDFLIQIFNVSAMVVANRFAITVMVLIHAHVTLDMNCIAITENALISMNVWMMTQIIVIMILVTV